jgi:hypothetical protein
MVMQLPERDKLSMSLEQMTSRLAIMMGGRVAEELVFGKEKVTSGASSDIEQATRLARMMVTRFFATQEFLLPGAMAPEGRLRRTKLSYAIICQSAGTEPNGLLLSSVPSSMSQIATGPASLRQRISLL